MDIDKIGSERALLELHVELTYFILENWWWRSSLACWKEVGVCSRNKQ